MFNQKSILGLITARGGSKRLVGKNLTLLEGKPLIAWTVTAAAESKYIDRLIISSEDEEILKAAKAFGAEVPFVRPSELSQDDTTSIDVVLHALAQLEAKYDYLLLLQPTSPLRTAEDIDRCIEFAFNQNADSVVSLNEIDKSVSWLYKMDSQLKVTPLLPKNEPVADVPKVFITNGALYFVKTEWLLKHMKFIGSETRGFVMPRERSIDIDTAEDLEICKWMLSRRRAQSVAEN